MEATLTGKAGTDAIRAYAHLGATDSRFDGAKVARAVRTARGRAKLLAVSVSTRMQRVVRMLVPRPRGRARRRSARTRSPRSPRRSASGHPGTPPHPSSSLSASQGEGDGTFRRGA